MNRFILYCAARRGLPAAWLSLLLAFAAVVKEQKCVTRPYGADYTITLQYQSMKLFLHRLYTYFYIVRPASTFAELQ